MFKETRILVIVTIVLIVAAIAFVLLRNNSSQNYSYNQSPTYTVAPGNTNPDLQQDLNTVDTSIKADNDSQTNINQDTQISQPNY